MLQAKLPWQAVWYPKDKKNLKQVQVLLYYLSNIKMERKAATPAGIASTEDPAGRFSRGG
ncbi:hypothetical protein CR205_09860 [Alteribacter lacisalsi]|uniref:Uncharacterized protein n=1 Tax=Alteribacter lacisalsi TaxID=2045244 RepID=A0A2W0HAG8_9BACI|nr:hypothetical protein CR205_09860 [Alteribacter lacisalsi]